MKRKEIEQRVAAEILTKFMFARDMGEVLQTWDNIYKQYDLCSDPFTHTPCCPEDYCKNKLKYDRQAMIERYDHCDGLD